MLVLMAFPITGSATILNPAPGTFYDDVGAELFTPSILAFSVELADPLSGEFGFYREGDSATKITIFDALDATGDVALIDFLLGIVVDVELLTPQSVFAPGLGDIGFYLTLGSTTIFSEASLNPLGSDWAAAFQNMGDPSTFIIGFETPLPPTGALTTVAFEVVSGISAVPEPPTVMLMLLSIPMLSFLTRRKIGKIIR